MTSTECSFQRAQPRPGSTRKRHLSFAFESYGVPSPSYNTATTQSFVTVNVERLGVERPFQLRLRLFSVETLTIK